ncbi:MAG TPA: transglutaminaseTgpA domain-containing protein [Dictyobacter sp.]|jgi:hypothetical protein|nr:transglutaminaseTgpA domain-containing protein [Dictyobacter sp.]
MHDAAVERLSKIISETPDDDPEQRRGLFRKISFRHFHLRLAEGWFSFVLLTIVVYSVIWCFQAAHWIDHLGVLTLTAAVGLVSGTLAAKQTYIRRWGIHACAVSFGILLALWQTLEVVYSRNILTAVLIFLRECVAFLGGGTGDKTMLALWCVVLVGFLLAYVSAWLLYHTRSPWLLLVVNATVLIFTLNGTTSGFVVFLILFLVASLFLLLRFNLYTSIHRWQHQGLRYSDELSWDVMQAGIFVSIGIIIFSCILPATYANPLAAQIWSAQGNPLVVLQRTLGYPASNTSGVISPNHGNFSDSLTLGGNPNLTNDVVFKVQFASNPQYLSLVSYDTYTNQGWRIEDSDPTPYPVKANTAIYMAGSTTYLEKQTIQIVAAPGEQKPYLVGASDISSISMPANVLEGSGGVLAWLGTQNLVGGQQYTVTSSISSVDVATLQSVPMPVAAPTFDTTLHNLDVEPPLTAYNQQLVHDYTQIPASVTSRIHALAQSIVNDAHAHTMYDKAAALETYLRTHYRYSTNVRPPDNEDPTIWFLFDNQQRDGFCTYFASAMTLMARSLGIPARVVSGYTYGKASDGTYIVRGVDAHSWVQVDFAGYGWINFEPSASYNTFLRPLPDQYNGNVAGLDEQTGATPGVTANTRNYHQSLLEHDISQGSLSSTTSTQAQLLRYLWVLLPMAGILLLFGGLCLLLWWRSLFRHQSLTTQVYGRVCVLAHWSGLQHQATQTPYEYLRTVSHKALSTTEDIQALERLADLYVRERWADPESDEHPVHTGEIAELPQLWRAVQPRLFWYLLHHPVFFKRMLTSVLAPVKHRPKRYKEHKIVRDDV